MGQAHIVGKTATTIYEDDRGYTCVKYHKTDVVKFKGNVILLDSGGWLTHTTKMRMNQASKQFNLGFQVRQENKEWYVYTDAGKVQFFNGIKIKKKHIEWTRVNSDVNGNPRFVCHYLVFEGCTYEEAIRKANSIGGRKFHNKQYGGGLVFQSYNLDSTETAILSTLDA